jgi:hypothetical protein
MLQYASNGCTPLVCLVVLYSVEISSPALRDRLWMDVRNVPAVMFVTPLAISEMLCID